MSDVDTNDLSTLQEADSREPDADEHTGAAKLIVVVQRAPIRTPCPAKPSRGGGYRLIEETQ